MPRKRASVRREEILAATVEEIESTGLRTLRVADVAARLGLSPSLVIYHFVTKEALVAAAFAHAGENDLYRARRLAATQKPASQRLRDVVQWYMPTDSTRSWKIWIDGWSAALFDDGMRSTFSTLDREWKTILSELIVAGLEAKEFRFSHVRMATGASANGPTGTTVAEMADGCATRILAYLDGLAVQLIFNPESVSPKTLSSWVDDFVARELE
ncbi:MULTISPECIES: TetR family transcriptional regulator C-terminal domain-containing protein [Brevibacterium]|uniref:TetR family transcriptional regulator n=1 Tax=Brevibacterium aurantiacum TaxID=273384 RepID=A0A2A3ZTJ5_BREAU|nr:MULTISPECIES: TetR/AcrR family transcriptional regulator [Brevibacterium]MDN5737490.1 TetR family transcriptional regulator [Brevibacterium aurantiacum]MDN5772585.1 TetR family transcriptional regulator [Brevibacterium aurantiacum]PCC54685.1 TetR family transcriptional regulator [Brevibacterium aurantiacum]WCE38893.1 TetR/AcrR family transcriptional regulator [Brevibacterium sp. BDJS002]